MSKKGSDTPSSIRIRENQRRSRNQRKELIQDLQRRVQEYELKGIAATQEMQRAARKVADENARLRSLLASRGVTRDEVDAYLRSFDSAAALVPAAAATTTTTAPPRHVRPVQQQQQQQQQQMPQRVHMERMPPAVQPRASGCPPSVQAVAESQPANQALPGVMPHQAHHAKQHANTATSSAPYEPAMPTTAPQQPSCCRPAESSMHETSATTYPTLEGDPDCPNTANCFCAPTPVPKERPADTGLLISCETAATIIAEMRGDADRNRIKDSLGCGGRKDCVVKNTLVLELMDER